MMLKLLHQEIAMIDPKQKRMVPKQTMRKVHLIDVTSELTSAVPNSVPDIEEYPLQHHYCVPML